MSSIWDDPEMKVVSDYVQFERPGDSVAGTVVAIRAKEWDDGSRCAELIIRTDSGDERSMTAGTKRLKKALQEKRPEIGDRISVTYTNSIPLAGGKALKEYDVVVTRKADAPREAAPATPPIQAAPDATALAAALAGLTPEQKIALGVTG